MKLRLWDGNVCVASTKLSSNQMETMHSSGILLFVNDYYTFQGFYGGYCNFMKVGPPVNVATWFR